jgi:hypothetical protein
VQRGLRASVKPAILTAQYHESRIRHFHATLDTYLTGEKRRDSAGNAR